MVPLLACVLLMFFIVFLLVFGMLGPAKKIIEDSGIKFTFPGAEAWIEATLHKIGEDINFKQFSLPASIWDTINYYKMSLEMRAIFQNETIGDDNEVWTWMSPGDSTTDLNVFNDTLKSLPDQIIEYAKNHETEIMFSVGTGLIALAASQVVPAVFVGALNLIGFRAKGPVAGAIAARIQSVVYGGTIPAGSPFSLAQAITMGGMLMVSGEMLIFSIAALSVGLALVYIASRWARDRDDELMKLMNGGDVPMAYSEDLTENSDVNAIYQFLESGAFSAGDLDSDAISFVLEDSTEGNGVLWD